MARPGTRGSGLIPLILEAPADEAGEVLRSVTFVGEGDGTEATSEVRPDARRWSATEAAAFHREHLAAYPGAVALEPEASGGYTFRLGPLSVDLLWFPGGDGALFYLVSRSGEPLRRLRTQAAGPEGRWSDADEEEPPPPRGRRASLREILHPAEVVRGAASLASRFEQEPYWQAEAVVAASIWLVLGLTQKTVVGPVWLMPASEALLLGALVLTDPSRRIRIGLLPRSRVLPRLALGLVGLVNTGSLALLVHELLNSRTGALGHPLILAASVIWVTNVIIFALAFWELDRGGPDQRSDPSGEGEPNFLFPQMTLDAMAQSFRPAFFDYFYVSATNATAFSPTDTMPLGARAKGLMLIQALASLVTVGLVAARAVNILK